MTMPGASEILSVDLGSRSYPIVIGANLLRQAGEFVPWLAQKRAAVVTSSRVAPLYLESLSCALRAEGVAVTTIVLPDGEEHKDWRSLNLVFDALLEHGCERKTTLMALGGGVIGDITGFAAASYLRGVPYIQVPTTLLAQVDSAVGGKTGINHPLGKNMIGAFYQPKLVLADTSTLDTLPDRELRAGLAEVIKYGLIRDGAFFEWLESHIDELKRRDPQALRFAIRRSCENKAAVVAQDERESAVRALLNLGHTFGHAIETGSGYGVWLHGEAVAAGTLIAAQLSQRLGFISEAAVARIRELYLRAGLPVKAPALGRERYLQLMARDKKVEAGRIRFVLLKGIGEAVLSDQVPEAILEDSLKECSGDG